MILEDFNKEPMRTEIKKIDDVNVLFQYGMVVPSFDTYNKQMEARLHQVLNGKWKFKFDPENKGVNEKWYENNHQDSNWSDVSVPSSWDLYDSEEFKKNEGKYGEGTPFADGYAWFKRSFHVNKDWINRFVRINFLGVNYAAWVFINGQYVDVHLGGHTYFSLDISNYLVEGENTICVRVYRRPWYENYQLHQDEGKIIDIKAVPGNIVDYWPYAGITRDVYLEATHRVTISKLLTNAKDHVLTLYGIVSNHTNEEKIVKIAFNSGFDLEHQTVNLKPNEVKVIKTTMDIKQASEWHVLNPVTYQAQVKLYESEELIDSLSVSYGMRSVTIQNTNLCVNSKPVFLKGINWHEETVDRGRSLLKEDYDLEFKLMKELGINFIRNSHYNRHPYAYEYANQNGFFMMDETENMWLNEDMINYQYETFKLSQALVAMTTWNNMNHPSIIIWSLLNEPGSDATHYIPFVQELKNITNLLDIQQRPVSSGHFKGGDDPAAPILDILGWNEYFGAFGGYWENVQDLGKALDSIHNKFPNKPIMITENGSWSRFGHKGNPTDRDNENWQAKMFTDNYNQVYERDFMVGYTYWVFKDYKSRAFYTRRNNGISTMGVVPFVYNHSFITSCNEQNVDSYKEVYYAIKDAKIRG